ncbi:MAG: radical SAM protein [Clostridia bacterium]|nr:radical SAM protein [Clostridia bacterium]
MEVKNCHLCPNECGADRTNGVGLCHAGEEARICRIALHPWEEPIISGSHGSGTVFFSGCSMHCIFCQNYKISRLYCGRPYSRNDLIDEIKRFEEAGAHNINFVNPTHYAHILYDVLSAYKPTIPVVYNTGGYDKVSTLRILDGLVDIYLPDLKYLSPEIAERYSGRRDYPEVACGAIEEMARQTGAPILRDGILQRGTVVRHLVLPGQSTEGVRIVEYLAGRYGKEIYLSVMNQYTPCGELDAFPEINRRVKPIEYKRVVAAVRRLGITQCFVQDSESSDESYIPPFQI